MLYESLIIGPRDCFCQAMCASAAIAAISILQDYMATRSNQPAMQNSIQPSTIHLLKGE